MSEVMEKEFMGKGRSKVWTYLIFMILLVIAAVIVNVVWNDPTSAREGMSTFFGLPSYTLALVLFLVGAIVFWLGLKMETDWPEGIGAFMITAAVIWGQFIIGWAKFDLGGLIVLPYLIPILTFSLLLIYAMKKSV
ncbi:MAG: hypothetical protein H0V17_36290 [Deltaproteobacteria bacterium]|nr:hypothetical protein [Deltaproteobacteria bacterium]